MTCVDSMGQWVMFVESGWGNRVLGVSDWTMPGKVTLNSGHGMNWHGQERRDVSVRVSL